MRLEGVVLSTNAEGDTTGVTLKDVKEVSNPGAPLRETFFIAATNIQEWSSGPADAKIPNGADCTSPFATRVPFSHFGQTLTAVFAFLIFPCSGYGCRLCDDLRRIPPSQLSRRTPTSRRRRAPVVNASCRPGSQIPLIRARRPLLRALPLHGTWMN